MEIRSEIEEVKKCFFRPSTAMLKEDNDGFVLTGIVYFKSDEYFSEYIEYNIEVYVDKRFPHIIPILKELDGKITDHVYSNKTCCLGTNLRLKYLIAQNLSFDYFFKNGILGYLLTMYCFYKTGKYIGDDRPHGAAGILQDYKNIFGFKDDCAAVDFLIKLERSSQLRKGRLSTSCPCGSRRQFNKCHGSFYSIDDFLKDIQWFRPRIN